MKHLEIIVLAGTFLFFTFNETKIHFLIVWISLKIVDDKCCLRKDKIILTLLMFGQDPSWTKRLHENSQTKLQFRIIAYAQYLNKRRRKWKIRMSKVEDKIVSGEVSKN